MAAPPEAESSSPEMDQQLQDGKEKTWELHITPRVSHTGSQYVNECLLTTHRVAIYRMFIQLRPRLR